MMQGVQSYIVVGPIRCTIKFTLSLCETLLKLIATLTTAPITANHKSQPSHLLQLLLPQVMAVTSRVVLGSGLLLLLQQPQILSQHQLLLLPLTTHHSPLTTTIAITASANGCWLCLLLLLPQQPQLLLVHQPQQLLPAQDQQHSNNNHYSCHYQATIATSTPTTATSNHNNCNHTHYDSSQSPKPKAQSPKLLSCDIVGRILSQGPSGAGTVSSSRT